MKKIAYLSILLSLLFLFSACGGGGGDDPFSDVEDKIDIPDDPEVILNVGTLDVVGPADLIALGSSTNTALTTGAIICTVKDASNQTMAGQAVTFYTNGGGTFSANTVTSDADGIAATIFKGQKALGPVKIWAQIGYKKSNEWIVTMTAGPAAEASVLTSAK
ncbi:MAG: Ig-like domain-containing protein, partial [Desulfuromonadales bacterium]